MKIFTNAWVSGPAILSVTMLFVAGGAAAQGPAGAGAAEAAAASRPRSYNPTKWFGKKDGKTATENGISVEQLDKKLEARLVAVQVLPANAALEDVCGNFVERVECVAALRASHDLGLNFVCVKASMTGVRTDANASSCRMPADDKPLNLLKTIHFLKPDADAKNAAKNAETAAREDLKDAVVQVSAPPGQ